MEGERCSWPATRPIKIEHVAADDGCTRWIDAAIGGDNVAAIPAVQAVIGSTRINGPGVRVAPGWTQRADWVRFPGR